jgi:hypothetical protein
MAAIELKAEILDDLIEKGFRQPVWADFMKTGVKPTGKPEIPRLSSKVNLELFSDILVVFTVKEGKLSWMNAICFEIQIFEIEEFQHSEIYRLWNELITLKEKFLQRGTSMLKSFMLAVKDAYFTGMDTDAFVAAVLSETDPYFHGMVKKVFEE